MQVSSTFFIFGLFVLLQYSSCVFAQTIDEVDTADFAQIAFQETSFSFGELRQGEKIEHTFTFKNIGNAPLVLNNVLSTCGCTVPKWSKEPIPYDSTGTIKVIFDSKLKIGRQNKVVTVRSNSKEGDFRLRLSGMVLPIAKK